jgi:hypothetical protein
MLDENAKLNTKSKNLILCAKSNSIAIRRFWVAYKKELEKVSAESECSKEQVHAMFEAFVDSLD